MSPVVRLGPYEVASYSSRVPYDLELAERVRALLWDETAVTEQRMFGGLAFLVGGNMAVAAIDEGGLMVRVDPSDSTRLVAVAQARPMEMRGRPIKGWLEVNSDGLRTKRQLSKWVSVGVTYARSLPPKKRTAATR